MYPTAQGTQAPREFAAVFWTGATVPCGCSAKQKG
jgi:hypothetical protein